MDTLSSTNANVLPQNFLFIIIPHPLPLCNHYLLKNRITPPHHKPHPLRNRCICALMLDCELRKGEVLSLTLPALHLSEGYILVQGKGNKHRIAPMYPALISAGAVLLHSFLHSLNFFRFPIWGIFVLVLLVDFLLDFCNSSIS